VKQIAPEACEFFKIGEHRPYAPHHGPGNNPYTIFDHGTREDAETTFRGEKLGKSAESVGHGG
jgi:hypothetical protein